MLSRGRVCAEAVGTAIGDQPFILGDNFSAAAFMLVYTLMLAKRFLLEGLPAPVELYRQRLAAPSAFQKSVS